MLKFEFLGITRDRNLGGPENSKIRELMPDGIPGVVHVWRVFPAPDVDVIACGINVHDP
jgi:hypothetical protein